MNCTRCGKETPGSTHMCDDCIPLSMAEWRASKERQPKEPKAKASYYGWRPPAQKSKKPVTGTGR